jgi:hypothetical protein
MTLDLHFVCKRGENFKRVGDAEFETGDWSVANDTADEAIGGNVYLHAAQRDVAWHGGQILKWRPSEREGRKIFSYVSDGNYKVKCESGWSQEVAIVRR